MTGIMRQLDPLGRVVIPKSYRRMLGMENAVDSFEIFLEGDQIILKKYQQANTADNENNDANGITGIIRQLDPLGRVVIPKEFRRILGMENAVDSFEIVMMNDRIILTKYQSGCIFCGGTGNTVALNDKTVCSACVEKLRKLVEIQ